MWTGHVCMLWGVIVSTACCPCPCCQRVLHEAQQMGTGWFVLNLATGSCSEPQRRVERIALALLYWKPRTKKESWSKPVWQLCAEVFNVSEGSKDWCCSSCGSRSWSSSLCKCECAWTQLSKAWRYWFSSKFLKDYLQPVCSQRSWGGGLKSRRLGGFF